MAERKSSISEYMQLSLSDLSMELESLGLKPAFTSETSREVLSEALLSTAWTLINLVHGRAMDLNDGSCNTSNKELLLRSENQRLESKIEHLKNDLKIQEKLVSNKRASILRMELDLKKQSQTIKKQNEAISQLKTCLASQEKGFKNELKKQESDNETLRDLVRKSVGIGIRNNVYSESLWNALGSLSATEKATEQADVHQAIINRLKSTNHILVGENLMLRDAMKTLHSDIHQILSPLDLHTDGDPALPDSIFRLPLSYSMKKINEIRLEHISKLTNLIGKQPRSSNK